MVRIAVYISVYFQGFRDLFRNHRTNSMFRFTFGVFGKTDTSAKFPPRGSFRLLSRRSRVQPGWRQGTPWWRPRGLDACANLQPAVPEFRQQNCPAPAVELPDGARGARGRAPWRDHEARNNRHEAGPIRSLHAHGPGRGGSRGAAGPGRGVGRGDQSRRRR